MFTLDLQNIVMSSRTPSPPQASHNPTAPSPSPLRSLSLPIDDSHTHTHTERSIVRTVLPVAPFQFLCGAKQRSCCTQPEGTGCMCVLCGDPSSVSRTAAQGIQHPFCLAPKHASAIRSGNKAAAGDPPAGPRLTQESPLKPTILQQR